MDVDFISSSHEVSLFDKFGDKLPCVGTIISSYLILTLASCLYGKTVNISSIKTNGGAGILSARNSTQKWEQEQMIYIRRVEFHPDFENSSSVNDIAIVSLDKNIDEHLNSTAKVMPLFNKAHQNQATLMNFNGHVCRENSKFSPLKISDSSQCSSSAFKSDKLCLFPLDSDETKLNSSGANFSCSSPVPGSSLICSSKEHGQFLCGLLAASLGNITENGRVYTNVSHHSKWIQSVNSSFDIYNPDIVKGQWNLIVPGIPVDRRDPLPYQLSIQFQRNPPDGAFKHICGAVILDESTAITAAHCFNNSEDTSRYSVVAGEDLLNVPDEGEQFLSIEKTIIHPEYARGDFKNGRDIAILHLKTKIRFDNYSQSAWLSRFPTLELTSKIFQIFTKNPETSTNVVTISGWGQISNEAVPPNRLQKGSVSILSREDCEPRLMRQKVTGPGIWCAFDPDTRTCNGDSGGPLVIQNFEVGDSTVNLLVGIVSFGAKNCTLGNTAVFFTDIFHFHDWIQENRKKGEEKNPLPSIIASSSTFSHTSSNSEQIQNPIFSNFNSPPFTPNFPIPQLPSFQPLNFGNSPLFQPLSSPIKDLTSLGNGQSEGGGVSSSSSKSCSNGICTESRTVVDANGKVTTYTSGPGGQPSIQTHIFSPGQGQNVYVNSGAFSGPGGVFSSTSGGGTYFY